MSIAPLFNHCFVGSGSGSGSGLVLVLVEMVEQLRHVMPARVHLTAEIFGSNTIWLTILVGKEQT